MDVAYVTQAVPSQPMKRVEDWKSRLIDLSRRNNLLYFKKNKRGNLTITQPDQQAVFNTLVLKKRHLEFWAPPEEDEAPEKPAKSDNAKGNSKDKTAKIAKTSSLRQHTRPPQVSRPW